MQEIIYYIKSYYKQTDRIVLLLISLFTAFLIFCNYYYSIDTLIRKNNSFLVKLFYWYIVFAGAFIIPYFIVGLSRKRYNLKNKDFYILLFAAPLIFAWKISASISISSFSGFETNNHFWNQVLYWPVLAIVIILILYFTWKLYHQDQPLYGLRTGNIEWKPYFFMLLIMVPLISLAATQNDFLSVYPKINSISSDAEWWQKLLFELSYGTDFFTIEFFFRGFLVLAFAGWVGKDAILPMACFYCTIHFGKPLGECISSYFGGLLLGIVVYNTRSRWGGLIVHLGIAWLMEIAGYLGNYFK